MSRHPLLRQVSRKLKTRRECRFAAGDEVQIVEEIVTVNPRLPLHQTRIRAGSRARIIAPIDDAAEVEIYYRFETYDEKGKTSGWWGFTRESNLSPAPRRSIVDRLLGRSGA